MLFTVFGKEPSASDAEAECRMSRKWKTGPVVILQRIELAKLHWRVHLKWETGTKTVPINDCSSRYGSAAGYIGIRQTI